MKSQNTGNSCWPFLAMFVLWMNHNRVPCQSRISWIINTEVHWQLILMISLRPTMNDVMIVHPGIIFIHQRGDKDTPGCLHHGYQPQLYNKPSSFWGCTVGSGWEVTTTIPMLTTRGVQGVIAVTLCLRSWKGGKPSEVMGFSSARFASTVTIREASALRFPFPVSITDDI